MNLDKEIKDLNKEIVEHKKRNPNSYDENGNILPISEEDRKFPEMISKQLISEFKKIGLIELSDTVELNNFLKNYPKEKYSKDITPVLLKVITEFKIK